MIDSIMALYVLGIGLLLLSSCLRIFVNFDYHLYYGDDEVSLRQLRLLYVLSEDVVLSQGNISFDYFGNQMNIAKKEDKVILSPGYQVLYDKIERFVFVEEHSCLYVVYNHVNQKGVKHIVGC